MRYFGLTIAFLAFSAVSSAQFLRVSSSAQISTSAGNLFQTNELDWITSTVASPLTRTASVANAGGTAQTTFFSNFGQMKGSTYASLNTIGSGTASSRGLFSSFNNFVGAGFFDTITLRGVGPISLTINYSLHTVNVDPRAETFAETQLKVDVYSQDLGNQSPGAIVHSGAGNRTDSGTLVVSGFNGQKFDLHSELSSLSSVIYSSSNSGAMFASSDAMNTATFWITPTSGSFTSASGSTYALPVPEPMTVVVIGLGSGLLLRRRRSA